MCLSVVQRLHNKHPVHFVYSKCNEFYRDPPEQGRVLYPQKHPSESEQKRLVYVAGRSLGLKGAVERCPVRASAPGALTLRWGSAALSPALTSPPEVKGLALWADAAEYKQGVGSGLGFQPEHLSSQPSETGHHRVSRCKGPYELNAST